MLLIVCSGIFVYFLCLLLWYLSGTVLQLIFGRGSCLLLYHVSWCPLMYLLFPIVEVNVNSWVPIDVAGLYFALTQLTCRNISYNYKFQAAVLGRYEYIFVTIKKIHNCHWSSISQTIKLHPGWHLLIFFSFHVVLYLSLLLLLFCIFVLYRLIPWFTYKFFYYLIVSFLLEPILE